MWKYNIGDKNKIPSGLKVMTKMCNPFGIYLYCFGCKYSHFSHPLLYNPGRKRALDNLFRVLKFFQCFLSLNF